MTVPQLREEHVPLRLVGAVTCGPLVEATSEAILIRVPPVGRFLVRGEGPVLVERAEGATDADLRCFRDGPVAAAAALLRGELALRAASVSIAGRAVVVCGHSAAGKSALAAALARRGHAVLADAVTVIARDPDADRPFVAPLAPDPVLWPDTVEELGLREQAARCVRPALAKRAYRLGPEPSAAPLAAVILLRITGTVAEARMEPLHAGAKLHALLSMCWHGGLADRLGRSAEQFHDLTQLAAAVPCVRLLRPREGSPATALSELVEGLVA